MTVQQELDSLVEAFPGAEAEDSGIYEDTGIDTGADGEQACPNPPKKRSFRPKVQAADQLKILNFVKQRAMDPAEQLFRPYRYDKAGVFARQISPEE